MLFLEPIETRVNCTNGEPPQRDTKAAYGDLLIGLGI